MMTDPIADMLSRIRNGSMARHDRVEMPHSRLKEHVAGVMHRPGVLFEVDAGDPASDGLAGAAGHHAGRSAGHHAAGEPDPAG